MKLNKIVTAGVCAALAMSLVACGASSTAASSAAASSEAASSVAASSEAASSEKLTGVQNAAYTLRNDTGAKISEVYFYVNGSEDKGENLAADGLEADGTVDVAQSYNADTEEAPTYTVEYVAEDGTTYVFDTLHFENAIVGMVGANGTEADAAATATVQGNF
ncbi:MAG: cytochrome C [Faecalibacterium sp.]|nr:cytochrome C [Faecalibacterium sp.]